MFRGETISLSWPEASAEQIKKTDTGFFPHIISFESSMLLISLGSYVDRNEEVGMDAVCSPKIDCTPTCWAKLREEMPTEHIRA